MSELPKLDCCALGARKSQILQVFLLEAIAWSMLGGGLGLMPNRSRE